MLIVLNLLIILFLLAMMAIWATYGLFSSFLHLIIVIVSGVVAFALWEPLAYLLLGRMPYYAWGIGLLAPFALSLILVRGIMDKFCRKNLHFHPLADQVGGGAIGIVSGVLSIGMLMIGIGFMPVPPDLMGYQPYRMSGNTIEENIDGGTIWVPAERISAGFFSMLSTGAMRPSLSDTPLAVYKADLGERASTFRLQDDVNQMKTAPPSGVKVLDTYVFADEIAKLQPIMELATLMSLVTAEYREQMPAIEDPSHIEPFIDEVVAEIARRYQENDKPSEIIDGLAVKTMADRIERDPNEDFVDFFDTLVSKRTAELLAGMKKPQNENKKFVFVDTVWSSEAPGTYNTDGWLRVALPQIRLQVVNGKGEYQMLPPVAYSLETNKLTGDRSIVNLLGRQYYAAYAQDNDVKISWMFAIPPDAKPYRFEARQLGFKLDELGEPKTNPVALAKVVGAAFVPEPEAEVEQRGTDRTRISGTSIGATGAVAELTEALPKALSPNSATSIEPNKDSEQWTAFKGEQELSSNAGTGGARKSRMRDIYVPNGSRLLRVKVDSDASQSLYGQFRTLAANPQEMTVLDNTGNKHNAMAYVLHRKDSSMKVAIRELNRNEITSLRASQLPRPGPNDEVYIYFQVPVGRTLTAFLLGNDAQEFEEPIEVTAN